MALGGTSTAGEQLKKPCGFINKSKAQNVDTHQFIHVEDANPSPTRGFWFGNSPPGCISSFAKGVTQRLCFTKAARFRNCASEPAKRRQLVPGVAIGAGWQSVVAYVNLVCYYIVGVPLGLVMGYKLNMGVTGIWYGLLFGTIVQTCVLFFMIYRTNWNVEASLAEDRIRKWGGNDSTNPDMDKKGQTPEHSES